MLVITSPAAKGVNFQNIFVSDKLSELGFAAAGHYLYPAKQKFGKLLYWVIGIGLVGEKIRKLTLCNYNNYVG